MSSIASCRLSAKCPRCEFLLLEPEWSESVDGHKSVYLWHCPFCGNDFQTIDEDVFPVVSDDEAIQDFFPTLLVA